MIQQGDDTTGIIPLCARLCSHVHSLLLHRVSVSFPAFVSLSFAANDFDRQASCDTSRHSFPRIRVRRGRGSHVLLTCPHVHLSRDMTSALYTHYTPAGSKLLVLRGSNARARLLLGDWEALTKSSAHFTLYSRGVFFFFVLNSNSGSWHNRTLKPLLQGT